MSQNGQDLPHDLCRAAIVPSREPRPRRGVPESRSGCEGFRIGQRRPVPPSFLISRVYSYLAYRSRSGLASSCPRLLFAGLLLALACCSSTLFAAGPIATTASGLPSAWNNEQPVRYQTDLGDLGNRTKAVADALVATAFSTWSGNALINLSTSRTGDLSVDITAANIISSGIFDSVADGKTPIIYDTDGSIISLIAGVGSENFMLGFAGPVVVAPDGEISEGRAVLNGFLLNGETDNAVLTVVTHELGHLLGLAHSQLNQEFFFDGDGPNDVQIPLMFPILRNVDDVDAPITLTKDDVMSAGFLYRTSGFDNNFGHILGGVADANNDEFSGANVVLRRVGDLGAVTLPFLGAPGPDTYSWPSGIRSANGTGGAFEFHLLPEGQYVMFVENINQSFTGGSSVGPFDPPPTGIVPEFYNGDDESSDAFTDDPQAFITINVTTGNFIEGLEFRLQGTSTVQLQLDDTLSSTISVVDGALAATQYQIRTFNATGQVSIELTTENGGDLDLFVRREIGVS